MCVLVLVTVLRRGWLRPLDSALLRGMGPLVQRVTTFVQESGGVVLSFARLGKLGRTVRVLEEENARLQSLLARNEGVEEENARLRAELRLLPRTRFHLLTAEVISRSTDGVLDAFVINRGTHNGVTVGRPVIVSDGIVVGVVRAADALTSIVVLLTDPSVRLTAETQGTYAEGLVHGSRGLDIIMDTIPRTATIALGDRVVTTGTDGQFPPNLLVGTIRSVNAASTEIFQAAQVAPLTDLRRLRVVSVILP